MLLSSCTQMETKVDKPVFKVDQGDKTNDFYDNEKTHELTGNQIEIAGEISNPGIVDLSTLPIREMIVKEAILDGDSTKFIGAYRYNGYSLYDLLNERVLAKKNADKFRPIIDLYVEVENADGEKVVLSWGELFYPVHRHEILIATHVMHIVPSKTKEYWPLPEERKLIVGTDLVTERNITNPVKITVKSLNRDFKVDRTIDPLFSDNLKVYTNDQEILDLSQLPEGTQEYAYPNVFYGRGMGIHGVKPFKGGLLKDVLEAHYTFNRKNLRTGMFTVCGIDGYRCSLTYGELFNRNDQSETLLIDKENYEGAGRFSLYVSGDFFSDRAIKAMSSIHFDHL